MLDIIVDTPINFSCILYEYFVNIFKVKFFFLKKKKKMRRKILPKYFILAPKYTYYSAP